MWGACSGAAGIIALCCVLLLEGAGWQAPQWGQNSLQNPLCHLAEGVLHFPLSQEGKLQQRGRELEGAISKAQAAELAAASDLAAASQQRQGLLERQAALRQQYEAAAGRVQGGGDLLRAEQELEALRGQLAQVSYPRS